jgi:hypothetical protein
VCQYARRFEDKEVGVAVVLKFYVVGKDFVLVNFGIFARKF